MLHITNPLLRHTNQSFGLHKAKRALAITLTDNFSSEANLQAKPQSYSYSIDHHIHEAQKERQGNTFVHNQNAQSGKARSRGPQEEHIERHQWISIRQENDSMKGAFEALFSLEARVRLFDPLLLRDQCNCKRCIDPDSQQKLFQSSDIPSNIRPYEIISNNNEAHVQWENDVAGYDKDHVTTITWDRINELFSDEPSRPPVTWDKALFEKHHQQFSWPEARNNSKSLHGVLDALDKHGLVFLEDVPQLEADEGISSTYGVEQIGAEIGPLRDSLYGRTWDVRSVANAKNIAYTHQYLGLHMDLLYMTNPPAFQILHCLQASPSGGGESVFVDAFHAADTILRRTSSPAQHPLCTYPVPYHYHHIDPTAAHQHSHAYRNEHPVIELDDRGNIANVNWSPPFQAPLRPAASVKKPGRRLLARGGEGRGVREWHEAAQEFGRIIERADMQFERLMRPGEAVVFNNRRVLHARRAFDVSKGPRWLKGAYVDGDSVWSKLRVLRELERVGMKGTNMT